MINYRSYSLEGFLKVIMDCYNIPSLSRLFYDDPIEVRMVVMDPHLSRVELYNKLEVIKLNSMEKCLKINESDWLTLDSESKYQIILKYFVPERGKSFTVFGEFLRAINYMITIGNRDISSCQDMFSNSRKYIINLLSEGGKDKISSALFKVFNEFELKRNFDRLINSKSVHELQSIAPSIKNTIMDTILSNIIYSDIAKQGLFKTASARFSVDYVMSCLEKLDDSPTRHNGFIEEVS